MGFVPIMFRYLHEQVRKGKERKGKEREGKGREGKKVSVLDVRSSHYFKRRTFYNIGT